MLIKVLSTYRGQQGLLLGGHIYELTKSQISLIQDELAGQRKSFDFEVVKNPAQINRPPRKIKQTETPSNKQTLGSETK
ncbi:hypothetical protein ACQ9LF_06280 [Anaerohalosphaeraceae bacterium U12dextr]|jgi:hypothetical protein